MWLMARLMFPVSGRVICLVPGGWIRLSLGDGFSSFSKPLFSASSGVRSSVDMSILMVVGVFLAV